MLPLGIFDSKFAKAYGKPEDEEKATFTVNAGTLADTLTEQYHTDAHFCFYTIEGEKEWPRLLKHAPDVIESQGSRVLVQYIAVDWDTPGHKKWTKDTFEEFFAKLDSIEGVFPQIAQYSALYTTAHGAHIVWTLDEAIEPHTAEGLLKGMTQKLRKMGLMVDELHDWTRLMRCPSVCRDGKDTKDEPFHMLETNDNTVKPSELPYVDVKKREFAEVDDFEEKCPEPTPMPENHPSLKMAKQRLIGRDCYDVIFGEPTEDSYGTHGRRNSNMFNYVGQAVGLLYPTGQFDPEKIFKLFCTSTLARPVDSAKEHPLSQLWRAVKTSWGRQAAQEQVVKDVQQEQEDNTQSLWDSVTSGFLEWCKVPGIVDQLDAQAYLQDKLLLITANGGSMVMQPNGYYDRAEISKSQLVARIRQIGMGSLINCYKDKTKKTKSAQDILDVYGLPVGSIAAGPEYEKGTVVTGMDSPLPCAILPMFERNPSLTPKYSSDVDMWLNKICQTDSDYQKLIAWIGWSLDFSQPIAALAIIGPGGIGKKLLMLGLAECFQPSKIADFTNIVAGFGDVLLETPLLWANEGFPQNAGGGKRIADLIRELVAGDPISVNRKFKTPVQIQANYRIVITANNDQCLTNLYAGQDLTADDRMAIAQRIVYIHASNNARIWLRQQGGLAFTGKSGARWVANQSGGVSDYVVARHFLWLHEQRPPVADGARFAVEGSIGAGTLVDDMALASGIAPLVVETLFSMGKSSMLPPGMMVLEESMDTLEEGVYVTTSSIRDTYRRIVGHGQSSQAMTDRKIANVLLSLCDSHSLMTVDGLRAHWYKINMNFLLAQAVQTGTEIGAHFRPFAE